MRTLPYLLVAVVHGLVATAMVVVLGIAVIAICGVRPVTGAHMALYGASLTLAAALSGAMMSRHGPFNHPRIASLLASPGTYLGSLVLVAGILMPSPIEVIVVFGAFIFGTCLLPFVVVLAALRFCQRRRL